MSVCSIWILVASIASLLPPPFRFSQHVLQLSMTVATKLEYQEGEQVAAVNALQTAGLWSWGKVPVRKPWATFCHR
jgi:hypothetical protein